MPDLNAQHIPERMLQAAISKQVSERMGSMAREAGEFTKGMTEEDAKAAKLLILEMMRNSFGEFYEKMKKRVESGKKNDSE